MSEIAVVRVKLVKDYAISISKNEIHSAKDAAIIFDEIIGLTEKDLQKDEFFWNKHYDFIKNNKRLLRDNRLTK